VLTPTLIEVKLPAGVSHHAKVRIAGQGLVGLFGGASGDLFLLVTILSKSKKIESFQDSQPSQPERSKNDAKTHSHSAKPGEKTLTLQNVAHHGLDVHADLSVTIPVGVLGGQVKVLTPSGVVQLSIPALASSGKTLKLKRQGLSQNGQTGDLLITLYLVSPERLSPAEKKLYEALRDLSHD
jgi:DnaJ-class molecular chaperone